MSPRLPISTLFPYTTLFRSNVDGELIGGRFMYDFAHWQSGIRLLPASAALLNVPQTTGDPTAAPGRGWQQSYPRRSEEHTSELQSLRHLVCRLLLEKKKKQE